MPWTVSVQLDSDQPDVGSATATWAEPAPSTEVFSFSSRVKVNVAEGNKFVAAAIAARDAWLAGKVKNEGKISWILSALNAADPKAKVV